MGDGKIRIDYLLDVLATGLNRYRAHEEDGDDMAQAGAELFSHISHATAPKPCAPSRYSTLAMVVRNNDPEDLEDIKQILLETVVPEQDEQARKLLEAIEERIALLRETEPDDEGSGSDLDGWDEAEVITLDFDES